MFWRATWICAAFVVSGAFESLAICQDDLEVPGLGNRRAFGGVIMLDAFGVDDAALPCAARRRRSSR